MIINLTNEELILAVKEYMLRRGMTKDMDLKVLIRGGRKGNGGTAEVSINPVVGPEIPAPKMYQTIAPEVSHSINTAVAITKLELEPEELEPEEEQEEVKELPTNQIPSIKSVFAQNPDVIITKPANPFDK